MRRGNSRVGKKLLGYMANIDHDEVSHEILRCITTKPIEEVIQINPDEASRHLKSNDRSI